MKSAVAKVVAFHRAVGHRVGDPANPDITHDQALRLDLLEEELTELREALEAGSAIGVADALGDICYVVIGAAVAWGIPLAEVFDEIHASNMTKVGGPQRADGKVLKGPNYRPPNIGRVLADAVKLGVEQALLRQRMEDWAKYKAAPITLECAHLCTDHNRTLCFGCGKELEPQP